MVLSNLDRELLKACLEGTSEAWEDFVERFLGLVTFVVKSCASSRGIDVPEPLRNDLVAEIFLALIENDFAILRRFRGQSSLGTYLVVISRRIATRRLLQYRRQTGTAEPLLQDVQSPGRDDTLALENKEEVAALLAKLPDKEATAIRMYHLEDRTYREIGSQIGIPENSVGPLLSTARHRIRELRNA